MNLEGRITIVKALSLPKITLLAIVLTLNFIWKTFDDQGQKSQIRVNKERAKIEQSKGGLGIMDIRDLSKGLKVSWMRKLLYHFNSFCVLKILRNILRVYQTIKIQSY